MCSSFFKYVKKVCDIGISFALIKKILRFSVTMKNYSYDHYGNIHFLDCRGIPSNRTSVKGFILKLRIYIFIYIKDLFRVVDFKLVRTEQDLFRVL